LPVDGLVPRWLFPRLEDVDEALLVDCFSVGRRDLAVVAGGLVAGEALLFAVIEQAVALHPLATAISVVVAGAVGLRQIARAERLARVGLGAQLVSRGVAPEVAMEIVAAERAVSSVRFHTTRSKVERARMILVAAREAAARR
jgi:hypothetical protein